MTRPQQGLVASDDELFSAACYVVTSSRLLTRPGLGGHCGTLAQPTAVTSEGVSCRWKDAEVADVDVEWLRTRLESIGVPNAREVSDAYQAGEVGPLLCALVLRQIWVWDIDGWRDRPGWMDEYAELTTFEHHGEQFSTGAVLADAWAALGRLLAAGVDRRDLALTARGLAYATAFGVLYAALNLGTSDDEARDLWDLIPDDVDAPHALWSLHELLLSADPSGRQGAPPADPT
jgi:hypothetical protein